MQLKNFVALNHFAGVIHQPTIDEKKINPPEVLTKLFVTLLPNDKRIVRWQKSKIILLNKP